MPEPILGGGPQSPLSAGPARQSSLRAHNLSLVLSYVVATPEGLSRAALAKVTGLTRATISDLVDLLLAAGLVRELAPRAAKGAGRPAIPVTIAEYGVVGMGIEIAVDHVAVAVVDLAGRVLIERIAQGDYRHSDPKDVIARIARLVPVVVDDLQSRGARLAGACVALPGLVGPEPGRLRHAPNLAWDDVDVATEMRRAFGWHHTTIEVGNDANLGATAEARLRVRKNPLGPQPSFLYITGEVGIGGALVQNGLLSTGVRGWAGEIGHMVVDPNGPRCECGAQGCLERYAGKQALLSGAGLGPEATWEAFGRAVREGQPLALAALDVAGQTLGATAASALNLLDVELVVLGGAYAPLAPLLIPTIQPTLERRAIARSFTGAEVRVEGALGGEFSALRGAAQSVVNTVISDPRPWASESPLGANAPAE